MKKGFEAQNHLVKELELQDIQPSVTADGLSPPAYASPRSPEESKTFNNMYEISKSDDENDKLFGGNEITLKIITFFKADKKEQAEHELQLEKKEQEKERNEVLIEKLLSKLEQREYEEMEVEKRKPHTFEITVNDNISIAQLKKEIIEFNNDDPKYMNLDIAFGFKRLKDKESLYKVKGLRKTRELNLVVAWPKELIELYQSSNIELKDILLKEGLFQVKMEMHVFWNDSNLTNMYFNSYLFNGPDRYGIEKFIQKRFFVNDKGDVKRYWLPFFSLKEDLKRFVNCSIIGDINDLHVYEHNFSCYFKKDSKFKAIPHLCLKFEGYLTESMELDDYPFDRQFLNIQMHFPTRSQKKYTIVNAFKAKEWMNILRHSRNVPVTVTKMYNITAYRLVRDKMGLDEQLLDKSNIGVLRREIDSSDIEQYYQNYNYELCFHDERIQNMKLIRLRLSRNAFTDFVRYVFAIMLLMVSPISLSIMDYHFDITDIITNAIALLFALIAGHYLLLDKLPNVMSLLDVIILCGYISIASWLLLPALANYFDNSIFIYIAILISLIMFVFNMILLVWKWAFNNHDYCYCCGCTCDICCGLCGRICRIADWDTLSEEELDEFYEIDLTMSDSKPSEKTKAKTKEKEKEKTKEKNKATNNDEIVLNTNG